MSTEHTMDFVIFVFYFAPTLCAAFLGHKNTLSIFALNLLAGWTGIGWIGALIWGLSK